MAAHLIQETDVIDVSNPPLLIYGQPFTGKTSAGQTADNPLTLDFDGGIQRTAFRRATLSSQDDKGHKRPLEWRECCDEEESGTFRPYRTLVVDTVGRMVDSLVRAVVSESAKHGSLDKGPNQFGWTAVKSRFGQWLRRQQASGFQVVFLAHEKEEREGDARYWRPAITGGSYSAVMELCDVVGYLSIQENRRVLDFNPTDRRFGKNPAGWPPLTVPDYRADPHFLAGLIGQASASLGKIAQASAAVAKVVEEWQSALSLDPTLDGLNAMLPDLAKLDNGTKRQVWHLIQQFAEQGGLVFDKATKKFQKGAA